jgi:hypothetical protein
MARWSEIGMKSEPEKGCTFQFYIRTRRTAPGIDTKNSKTDFQLIGSEDALREDALREDALREACGVEVPGLQNGSSILNIELDLAHSMIVPTPKSNIFHTLVVEDNLVNQRVVTKQMRSQDIFYRLPIMVRRPLTSSGGLNIGMGLRMGRN